MPFGQVAEAIKDGRLDAFELNNPTTDRSLKAQDIYKHYMMAGLHQPAEYFEISFNKTKFEALPQELQYICQFAAEAASTANYNLAMNRYPRDLERLIQEDGVQIARTPDGISKELLKGWDIIIEKYSAADPFFAKVVKSQKEWSERVGYYDIMNAANLRLAYEHYFPGRLRT